MARITVSIGAGHGGIDSGAVSSAGVFEKNMALDVARRAADKLNAAGEFDVRMIREDDRSVPTGERLRLAGQWCSECHIEVHMCEYDGTRSYADVWYPQEMDGDAEYAEEMSARIAAALGTENGGARKRCRPPAGKAVDTDYEDYYDILDGAKERLISHMFFAECGFIDNDATAERLGNEDAADAVAGAIAATVCRIFGVGYETGPLSETASCGKYVFVSEGRYFVRMGPGPSFKAFATVGGGEKLELLAGDDGKGWIKVAAAGGKGYISTAVLSAGHEPAERRVRRGCYAVRTGPGTGFGVLGSIRGGESYGVSAHGGWCRFPYGGRAGYARADSFE